MRATQALIGLGCSRIGRASHLNSPACLAHRRALRPRSIARHHGRKLNAQTEIPRGSRFHAPRSRSPLRPPGRPTRRNIPTGAASGSASPFKAVRGQPSYDPTKSWGKGQQAPLTPEYQAVLEANLKDQENGGHGGLVGWTCRPYGMPMMMYGFTPLEFVVTPKTTYVLDQSPRHHAPHLHRRPHHARRHRAELPGILDRPLGRSGRRRRLRRARGRDPQLQGPALLRRGRHAAPHRRRVRLQGAHLPRQERSPTSCTTRSRRSITRSPGRGR